MAAGHGMRPRFRVRVEGHRAWTPTGWSWWYAVIDTSKPDGQQIVVSGCRPTWRLTLREGIEARDTQERLAERIPA